MVEEVDDEDVVDEGFEEPEDITVPVLTQEDPCRDIGRRPSAPSQDSVLLLLLPPCHPQVEDGVLLLLLLLLPCHPCQGKDGVLLLPPLQELG